MGSRRKGGFIEKLSRSIQYWLFLLLSTLLETTFSPAFCVTKIAIQPNLSGKTTKQEGALGRKKVFSQGGSKSFAMLTSN